MKRILKSLLPFLIVIFALFAMAFLKHEEVLTPGETKDIEEFFENNSKWNKIEVRAANSCGTDLFYASKWFFFKTRMIMWLCKYLDSFAAKEQRENGSVPLFYSVYFSFFLFPLQGNSYSNSFDSCSDRFMLISPTPLNSTVSVSQSSWNNSSLWAININCLNPGRNWKRIKSFSHYCFNLPVYHFNTD